jgi:hypothetical protein
MFSLLSSGALLEQNAKQETQTPTLEPSNFINAVNSINQATIPQHHHWPAHYKANKQQERNSHKQYHKFFHIHLLSYKQKTQSTKQ